MFFCLYKKLYNFSIILTSSNLIYKLHMVKLALNLFDDDLFNQSLKRFEVRATALKSLNTLWGMILAICPTVDSFQVVE